MKFVNTPIEGLVIIEPTVFADNRGYFLESYNKKKFEEAIGKISFVQDNESKSSKGVLRGLHFQKPPYAQIKLVRCIQGNVLDVAVDIRDGSETYGKHVSVELTAENKKQVFIPRGFAHGFLTLDDDSEIFYQMSDCFVPESALGIRWNDPSIGITKLRASTHPVKKWREWDYKFVMNGMVRDFDGSQIYEYFANDTPSRHLTIVFNVFVILQIFNMI